MTINIEEYQLRDLLENAARKGALKALESVRYEDKDKFVSQREAIRILKREGRNKSVLTRWIDNGQIEKLRSGIHTNSKFSFSKERLEYLIKKDKEIVEKIKSSNSKKGVSA